MAPGGLQRNNTISLKQSVFMVGRRCCAAGYASRAAARPYRLVFMVGRRCCAAGYAGRAAERPFRLNYMLIIIGNWYQSVAVLSHFSLSAWLLCSLVVQMWSCGLLSLFGVSAFHLFSPSIVAGAHKVIARPHMARAGGNRPCSNRNRACSGRNRACSDGNRACADGNRACADGNRACADGNKLCAGAHKAGATFPKPGLQGLLRCHFHNYFYIISANCRLISL
jgi:hypothetical protein